MDPFGGPPIGSPARRSWLALASLVLALEGCGFNIKPMPSTDAWPATTKTTLRAGVYYSPQFANSKAVRAPANNTLIVPIGEQSVHLFNELYSRVFEATTAIRAIPSGDGATEGLDVLIAPSLEHFDFRTGLDAQSDRYSVAYRNTLYNVHGVPLASWVVFGNARKEYWSSGGLQQWIENDMNDAAVKFLQGFERETGPALAALARKGTDRSVGIDPHQIVLAVRRAELPGLTPEAKAALGEAGVVPLQFTAQNTSDRDLVVRASDMRIRLKDGQVIAPSSPSSVLGLLERASMPAGMVAAPLPVFGSAFALLTAYLEHTSKQEERELQFKSVGQSMFEDRTLAKGREQAGIVLFQFAKGQLQENATLMAWVVDPSAAEGVQIVLPLR